MLITGLSLLATGFTLAASVSDPLLFFCFLGVTGIGYGFTPPSLYAIMSDLLPHRRGLGTSLDSVTYGIGGAIGAVLASRIVAAFGWRTAFLTVGLIAAADMLLQLYWIRDQHRSERPRARGPQIRAFRLDRDSRGRRIHRRIRILELRRMDSDRVARR